MNAVSEQRATTCNCHTNIDKDQHNKHDNHDQLYVLPPERPLQDRGILLEMNCPILQTLCFVNKKFNPLSSLENFFNICHHCTLHTTNIRLQLGHAVRLRVV